MKTGPYQTGRSDTECINISGALFSDLCRLQITHSIPFSLMQFRILSLPHLLCELQPRKLKQSKSSCLTVKEVPPHHSLPPPPHSSSNFYRKHKTSCGKEKLFLSSANKIAQEFEITFVELCVSKTNNDFIGQRCFQDQQQQSTHVRNKAFKQF